MPARAKKDDCTKASRFPASIAGSLHLKYASAAPSRFARLGAKRPAGVREIPLLIAPSSGLGPGNDGQNRASGWRDIMLETPFSLSDDLSSARKGGQ
jgi:hypothetical protein